jgi:hypothetical protein
MKNRLEDLMQKASVAAPPELMSKSGWVPYLPILRILMEERGYTLMAAVHWLVQQGEIPASRHQVAYRGLSQILARREAKKVRQQIRMQQQLQEVLSQGAVSATEPMLEQVCVAESLPVIPV